MQPGHGGPMVTNANSKNNENDQNPNKCMINLEQRLSEKFDNCRKAFEDQLAFRICPVGFTKGCNSPMYFLNNSL